MISVCLFSCSHWTRQDTYRQGCITALVGAEWAQTRDMANRYDEDYWETSAFLGKNPSTAEVDRHFLMVAVGSAVLAYALPSKLRKYLQLFYIGYEANMVRHNHAIGLRIHF